MGGTSTGRGSLHHRSSAGSPGPLGVDVDALGHPRKADARVVSEPSGVLRIGNSSVRTREEARLADGGVAARMEAVIVFRDLATGKSRPITPEERAGLERYLLPQPQCADGYRLDMRSLPIGSGIPRVAG